MSARKQSWKRYKKSKTILVDFDLFLIEGHIFFYLPFFLFISKEVKTERIIQKCGFLKKYEQKFKLEEKLFV